MEQYECPVCGENCYYNPERRLYYSEICSHRLCDRCLAILYNEGPAAAPAAPAATGAAVASAAAPAAAANAQASCPICRRPVTRGSFVLTEPEVELFSVEKEVRQRVNNV